MSDEPDGDPEADPSETTSEEDPFIYPADDSDDSGGADASSTDAGASQSGADTSSSGAGTSSADTGTSASDSGTSASGSDASARGADTSSSGADSSATVDGTSSRDTSGGASAASGSGAARSSGSSSSGGRAGASSPTSSPSGSGSRAAASRSGGAARDSSGTSTSTGSARSASAGADTTDVGRHATDRRPHASESGAAHPPSPSSTGGHGRQRRREAPAESGPTGVGGWARWFWTTEEGPAVYLRDVVTSVAAVLVVGLVLFAISGIWPPMVAVESGSMEPNMQVGDLVFIVDNERYSPEGAQEHQGESTGVVPADRATETGRSKFGGPGDVIVFRPNGLESTTPVIHRAMLWVDEGENWYDRADPDAVGTASDCAELNHCPAPHAGFITKGDHNPRYDQQTTLSEPVRPEWIVGTAELRIPYLGHIRLAFSGQVAPALDASPGSTAVATDRPTATPSPATQPATAGSRSSGAVA